MENEINQNIIMLQSLKSYRLIYIQYLNGKIDKNKLEIFKKKLNTIPQEIVEYLEFFIKLDNEFPKRVNTSMKEYKNIRLFSYEWFKDKKWEGFWLKATGTDAVLFINWLYSAITYEKYKNHDIEYWFFDSHPKEKYLPYSIKKANEFFKKYYKK